MRTTESSLLLCNDRKLAVVVFTLPLICAGHLLPIDAYWDLHRPWRGAYVD